MLDEALVEFCSPTLAGIKTGNIFTARAQDKEVREEISALNRILVKKGLRLIPLKKNRKGTLVYLYRPSRLEKDLEFPEARLILEEKGYPCGCPDRCVVELIKHLVSDEDFPHEIGLFLGYPPADVKGFMNSPCEGVKCVGCWKVYGNEKEAKKTFARYDKCRDIYREETKKGKPLDDLIVDTREKALRLAI